MAADALGGGSRAPTTGAISDGDLTGAPPSFFLGWTGVYLVVLGALAAQIAIYAALTAIFR
jgi:hypothetical protein